MRSSTAAQSSLADLLLLTPLIWGSFDADDKRKMAAMCRDLHSQVWAHVRQVELSDEKLLMQLDLPCLEDLHMKYRRRSAATTLCQADWPRLQKLVVTTPNVVFLNWSPEQWPCMQYVRVSGLHVQSACTLPHWSNLEELKLSDTTLDLAAISHIVLSSWPKLKVLWLDNCLLGSRAIRVLAKGQWPKMNDLSLQCNNLGLRGVQYLINGDWSALASLSLVKCKLTTASCHMLLQGKWPNLQRLALWRNSYDQGIWNCFNVHPQAYGSTAHHPLDMTKTDANLVLVFPAAMLRILHWPHLQQLSINRYVH